MNLIDLAAIIPFFLGIVLEGLEDMQVWPFNSCVDLQSKR